MDKKQIIIDLIKQSKPMADYFFMKAGKAERPHEWLEILYRNDFFSGKSNPGQEYTSDAKNSYTTPLWNVLLFLENVAKKNSISDDDSISKLLVDIVNGIVSYRDNHGQRIENYLTDTYIANIISHLPGQYITSDLLYCVGTFLDGKTNSTPLHGEIVENLLPKLISDRSKAHLLYIIPLIFSRKKAEKYYEMEGKIEGYFLSVVTEKYTTELYSICGAELTNKMVGIIIEIVAQDPYSFSAVVIPSIEPSDQTIDPFQYENLLVGFIRTLIENSKREDVILMVEPLQTGESSILIRILIYAFNYHYENVKDTFWEYGAKLFRMHDSHHLRHELYKLFQINCQKFTAVELLTVIQWIENFDYWTPENSSPAEKQHYIAYNKCRWYDALKSTNIGKSKYEEYKKLYGKEIEHPDTDYFISTFAGDISPVSPDELSQKSINEIVMYLNTFEEGSEFRQPTKHGLSRAITELLLKAPDELIPSLKEFLVVDYRYQYALLSGLRELTQKKYEINWGYVFDFIFGIFKKDDFWGKQHEEGYNFRNWIVNDVGSLIINSLKSSFVSNDEKVKEKITSFLISIIDRTDSVMMKDDDIITSVLNSPYGRVLSALVVVQMSYFNNNANKANKSQGWHVAIKSKLEDELYKYELRKLEVSSVMGQYFQNFFAYDKSWSETHINVIFFKQNNIHWSAAFASHIGYSATVYKDIYNLVKKHGHYLHGVRFNFKDKFSKERVVSCVAAAYYAGLEEISGPNSALDYILRAHDPQLLLTLVKQVTYLKWVKDDPTYRAKTKLLWKDIVASTMSLNSTDEVSVILGELFKWNTLVSEIDTEIYELLIESIKYVSKSNVSHRLLKDFFSHAQVNPHLTGDLYLKMLDYYYPQYQVQEVKDFVELLYNKGEIKIVEDIKLKYYQRSDFSLKGIGQPYMKNHSLEK